jgi:hypothetical protein
MKRQGVIYLAATVLGAFLVAYIGTAGWVICTRGFQTFDAIPYLTATAILIVGFCVFTLNAFAFLRRAVVSIERTGDGFQMRLAHGNAVEATSIRPLWRVLQLSWNESPAYVLFLADRRLWICSSECFSCANL